MNKMLVLRRERISENQIWMDEFLILYHLNVQELECHLRKSVQTFLCTKEGNEMAEWTNWCFNWGDAIQHTPDSFFKLNGLKLIDIGDNILVSPTNIIEISVEQDEVLWREKYKTNKA